MADYISIFSGSQMDDADTLALNPDATPTLGSGNLVTSDGIARAVNAAQYSSAPAIVSTASGAVASFADGSASPMRSVVAQIVASQAGSGDPAPDNIRPISGYTGANVTRAGANMLDNDNIVQGALTNPSDTKRASNRLDRSIYINAGDVVTLTARAKASGMQFALGVYTDPDQSTTASYDSGWKSNTFTWTATVSGYAILGWRYSGDLTITPDDVKACDFIVTISTPEVFNISWQDEAGTVYGGTVDLVSGVLTVTHKAVDLGTLAWTQATSGGVVYFRTAQADKAYGLDNILCSCYRQGTAYVSSTPDCSIAGRASSREVIVKDSTKAALTAEEFATAVSGQTLVYELTTAETYTLTGQEVASLLGQNNVWNDAGGDTEVEYVADTALALAEILPEAPAADGTYTLTCTVSGGVATYSWA